MKEIGGIPEKLMLPDKSLPQAKNTLGKDDFMKLLLTQLRHQDPLKPMDHHEFATQLAQFGQLEQLTNIGSGITALKSGMGTDSKLQVVAMIGKRVQANGSEIDLIAGENVSLNHGFPDSVKPMRAQIFDQGGKLVRELGLSAGSGKEILWDGKDQDGVSLPSGKYLFRAQGVGADGQSQEASSELSGQVVGVEMDGEEPSVIVKTSSGQSRVALGKIKKIFMDSPATPDPASTSEQGAGNSGGVARAPSAETAQNRESPAAQDESQVDDLSRERDRHAFLWANPMGVRR
jgi:flagellar basal-body rod modification protein FlgD